MSTVTFTAQGQMPIPPEIQALLNLQPGDQIAFVVEPNGRVYIQPAHAGAVDVRELSGLLYQPSRAPISLQQMETAIIEGATESL
jgi:AbrB family looped-hinge helix DNA binding protein